MLLKDQSLVERVLEDFRTAPISEPEKILFAFLDRVNQGSNGITAEQVEAVVASGWSEEAIYDAVTVCALFNFYNRWVDATGVSDLPPQGYHASGARLASDGYIPGANPG